MQKPILEGEACFSFREGRELPESPSTTWKATVSQSPAFSLSFCLSTILFRNVLLIIITIIFLLCIIYLSKSNLSPNSK